MLIIHAIQDKHKLAIYKLHWYLRSDELFPLHSNSQTYLLWWLNIFGWLYVPFAFILQQSQLKEWKHEQNFTITGSHFS